MVSRNPLTGLNLLQQVEREHTRGPGLTGRNPLTGLNLLQRRGFWKGWRAAWPRRRNPLTGLNLLQHGGKGGARLNPTQGRNPLTGLNLLQPSSSFN